MLSVMAFDSFVTKVTNSQKSIEVQATAPNSSFATQLIFTINASKPSVVLDDYVNILNLHKKAIYLHIMQINLTQMQINRIKAVLAEKGKTNKWLAEKLSKNETTVSRWCTNEVQPSIETFIEISHLLNIDIKDLINSTKTN